MPRWMISAPSVVGGLVVVLGTPLVPMAVPTVLWASVLVFLGLLAWRASKSPTLGSRLGGLARVVFLGLPLSAVVALGLTSVVWGAWGPTWEGVSGPVGVVELAAWISNTFVVATVGMVVTESGGLPGPVVPAGHPREEQPEDPWVFDPDR